MVFHYHKGTVISVTPVGQKKGAILADRTLGMQCKKMLKQKVFNTPAKIAG